MDFWSELGSRNLYLEIISVQELCNVGMNKVTFGEHYEGLENAFLELTNSQTDKAVQSIESPLCRASFLIMLKR